jgi:pimeloyl-ACP methyl ester carboxylesterase
MTGSVEYFISDGLELAYRDEGRGPAVLLIHGFASDFVTNWVKPGWTRTLVEAGYRAVCIDNRGHGRSEKSYDPERYSAPLMALDAVRLLDRLGIDRAHVMGYSMGARIAAFVLHRASGRVASGVFAGMGYNMVRGLGGSAPIAKAFEAASIDEVTNDTARSFRAFAESNGGDLKALAACLRGPRVKVTEDMLRQIDRPVLVAVGSEDGIAGSPQELAALIPGAEVLVIPRRDHMKAVGDRVYKEGVLAFLARQRPTTIG